jgi:soluble lytic murein transglycosylase-like protein
MPPKLPSLYDAIINKYRAAAPLEFIKVLIKHESSFNPNSDMGLRKSIYSPGAAKGLMQVVHDAREDYNKRFMTGYSYKDLFDPDVNIKIGTDLLNRIILSYNRNHPESLATNWNDPRWVELLVLGWNAGYSEGGGVGKVVAALERAGIPKDKITVDNVVASAHKVGALTRREQEDLFARARWAKSVARSFLVERARQKEARKNVT